MSADEIRLRMKGAVGRARNVIDDCPGDVFRFGVFHADPHPANGMILCNEAPRGRHVDADRRDLEGDRATPQVDG